MTIWQYAVMAALVIAGLVDAYKAWSPLSNREAIVVNLGLTVAISFGYLYWASWADVLLVAAITWGFLWVLRAVVSTLQAIKDRNIRR